MALVRTPESNVAGLHLQVDIQPDRLAEYGLKTWTILHDAVGYVAAIKQAVPDAVVCVRTYLPGDDPNRNWHALSPEGEANSADKLARQYLAPTDFWTPANEMNLPGETGGHQASYEEIRDWSGRFADEWNRLGHYCGIVSPALSPGHSEDQNDWGTPENPVIGYEILKPAWDKYDLIGVHCYWNNEGSPQFWDPELRKFYARRNVETYRRYWPDKDCWMGEWNAGGVMYAPSDVQERHAAECAAYVSYLASLGYVRAATYFLDASGDQPYQVKLMPPVRHYFATVGHARSEGVSPLPPPPPDPHPDPRPDQAALVTKYNLTVAETPTMAVVLTEAPYAEIELRANAPAGARVVIHTSDGQNRSEGVGYAAVVMVFSSYYDPSKQQGPWVAECEGASVAGLGMKGGTNHEHPNVTFVRREPTPVPVPPPADDGGWQHAFADLYRSHPDTIGKAAGPIAYLPAGFVSAAQDGEKVIMTWDGTTVTVVPKS